MLTLIDYILDLFRNPAAAAAYIADPEQAMRDAGVPPVSAATMQAVAASAVPAGLALGGGDPVVGLQRAVADYHSIASPLSPQTTWAPAPVFAPETDTEFASRNTTDLASHNNVPVMSPDQHAGANAQQGAFNLGFGDITLGDKTSNTATNGGVVATGDTDGPIVTGDGAVLGHGNTVNNGDVWAGAGSHVAVGKGNEIEDNSQHAGGNVISGNDAPVISDVDMSGGHGGNASASGAGGLLGIGGGHANAGGGGSAGSIIIADNDTHTAGGNQTTAGGNLGSDNTRSLDSSVHTTTHTSTQSSLSDNSVVDSHASTDSSVHSSVSDSSVHQAGALNANTNTELDSHAHTDLGLF
jgi:hypothetical protein